MNELSISKLTRIKKGLKFYLEFLLIMDEKEFSESIVNTSSAALPNEIKETKEFIRDLDIIIKRKSVLNTY